jgi:hypothetical protein
MHNYITLQYTKACQDELIRERKNDTMLQKCIEHKRIVKRSTEL